MKITEDYYATHLVGIEERYLKLADELTEQLLDGMDWDCKSKQVDGQKIVALWLKVNEQRCENALTMTRTQQYKAICNTYRDALNKMWNTAGDWVGRDYDCFDVADCYISNAEVRFVVDNEVPWDTFYEWYRYNEQIRYGQELGKEGARVIIINRWCSGFPEDKKVPESIRKEWEKEYWENLI